MLPVFNSAGNLPAGIHEASLAEIESRFSINYIRKVHFQHLILLINDLKLIGCKRIYIDGSFVTSKVLPNDIDVCWETTGVDFMVASYLVPILFDFSDYGRKEQQKRYHADIFPANIVESATRVYFLDFFQIDKNTGAAKGIIKLEI